MKMNARFGKPLIWAIFAFLCLSVVGSSLNSSAVLAQEMIQKIGEVAGGSSDSIPVQLKVGKMVQGELIAEEGPLRVRIVGPSGKVIRDCGHGERGGFYYAAEVDGMHYIVLTNPDESSTGTRSYTMNYAVLTSGLAPGTGSGKPVGEEATNSFMSDLPGWVIIVVVILIVLVIRRAKRGGPARPGRPLLDDEERRK